MCWSRSDVARSPPRLRRTLAYDAAALVAETLAANQFAVAELSANRAKLSIRIAKVGDQSDESTLPTDDIPTGDTNSLAGFALATAQPVAVDDFNQEKRFQDAFLRQLGIRSAAAIPLQRGNASFGALLIACSNPRHFAVEELHYFETIAHLVSTTIAHERTREEVESQRRFRVALMESSASLMMVLASDGKILQVNRAAVNALGFKISELAERNLFSTLVAHEDIPTTQRALSQVADGDGPVSLELVAIAKSGRRKCIQWSVAGLADTADRLERIVMTGIDVTRQREVEAELTRFRPPSSKEQAFGLLQAAGPSNRRKRDRRLFPFVQMIAPLVDGTPPQEHQYQPYQCRDISPTGFQFFSPNPPAFKNLMLALGSDGSVTYLSARVMHSTQIKRNGKQVHVVGCQFHSRIKLEEVVGPR